MIKYDFRNCDAMELLSSLPDKSVDCVITDPPYGTTGNPWDIAPNWPTLMKELLRISNGAVLIFSQMPVACDVISAARDAFRLEWIWEKSRPSNFVWVRQRPLKAHESILVFATSGSYTYNPQMVEGEWRRISDGSSTQPSYLPESQKFTRHPSKLETNEYFPRDVLKVASEGGKGIHPTQKPVELVRYFVRTYTSKGGTVLDPYAGSGTTGEACALEERSFVGSELNDEYYKKALERINFSYSQERLF